MSEIELPLDIWLARLEGGWNFTPKARLNVLLKTNLSDSNSAIIDRDWMTPSRPWQVDVYSESSVASSTARIADMNLEWTFHQQDVWNLYAGFGYQYQYLDYEGRPVYQYSPSGLPGFQYQGAGELGLTYDFTASMLYLLIGSDYQLTPQLRLSGRLAYAPWVGLDDTTKLLLRNKVSEGDMDGYAYMADLSGIYYFLPKWFFEAGLQYTYISADGTQHQSVAGRPLGTLDVESETRQSSGYLTLGYTF
jgi:outer membrane protease